MPPGSRPRPSRGILRGPASAVVVADEYRIPEAIADALALEHLHMAPGDTFLWELIDRLCEVAPHVTVAELRDALVIYGDRYAAGIAALNCLPTVPGPDAVQ